MCTVVVLRRPDHRWPLILAANRDEMSDRPWSPPARHWPDRPEVRAGLDQLAGGTWLGLNDTAVVAAILNRMGTLGPLAGKRSRGELPLEALDHADAADATQALRHLAPRSYRPFNMIVADNRDAAWLRSDGDRITATDLPEGVSMVTAFELNDRDDPRIRHYRPRFEMAPAPDPDAGDWTAWEALLADGLGESEGERAMCLRRPDGFATVSSALIALPSRDHPKVRPVWRFAAGPPDRTPFLTLPD